LYRSNRAIAAISDTHPQNAPEKKASASEEGRVAREITSNFNSNMLCDNLNIEQKKKSKTEEKKNLKKFCSRDIALHVVGRLEANQYQIPLSLMNWMKNQRIISFHSKNRQSIFFFQSSQARRGSIEQQNHRVKHHELINF
jgi:hypothetical protein